ncbi:neuferricin [Procambarus clarkii]|uniref:neuferricin n=1 Tax=Procambarus clarkii TaxID=6728 RepID=UPI001E675F8C|nr:neuferricin-like [Procambarus clarkii]
MNGFIKLLLATAVGVAVVGVAIHEVWPGSLASVVMKSEGVRAAVMALHNLLLVPGTQQEQEQEQPPPGVKKERIFTVEELARYDGREGNKGPYLALLGRVYNVKKGKKFYGTGGGYEFFSGRDGSRAFVTGDFTEEGLIDDISGLTSSDYIGLDEWTKFYESDYKYVGKVIGRFYNEKGEPTSYYYDVQRWISQAYNDKENENKEKKMFPPCNSEWAPESGTRVWCTTRSGGVGRDWVGVPRKLYNPGHSKPRCACVKDFGPPSHDPTRMPHDDNGDLDHPNLEEYPGCISDQPTCTFKED